VDGELRDLAAPITKDAKLAIVTPKAKIQRPDLHPPLCAHIRPRRYAAVSPNKLGLRPARRYAFSTTWNWTTNDRDDFAKIDEEMKKIPPNRVPRYE